MVWAPAWYKAPITDEEKLSDPWWRICNLYKVVTEQGKSIPFRPNPVQADYYWKQWYFDLVLKSRQHGFTTLKCIEGLDACIWRENFHAHLIAHTREDSERLFQDKIRWVVDQLLEDYPELAAVADTTEDNSRVLRFPNGSTMSCGTSMRGGTLQWLHISEHGKICAHYPDKAKEIRSGALNTVHVGLRITIESTAEGRQGDFYDYAETARKRREAGGKLSKLDFRFHFYAWHQDPKNILDPRDVVLTPAMTRYFNRMAKTHGLRFTPGQKAWYAKKIETQKDLMFREHPTTPEEAFQGATEGKIYGPVMLKLRRTGRIVADIPFERRIPVDTAWDLGKGAHNAIWLHQYIPMEGVHRWLWFLQSHRQDGRLSEDLGDNSPADHVASLESLRSQHGFVWGRHYLPHDIVISDWSAKNSETRQDVLEGLGLTNIQVVTRIPEIGLGISKTELLLASSVFSEKGCAAGIVHLENYRWEWNERLEAFDRSKPVPDQASHCADAIRQLAQEWYAEPHERKKAPRKRSWRSA